MEETEDKLPKKFLEAFNIGFEFSKAFPDVSQNILEQNNSSQIDVTPVGGIFAGIEQNLKEARELINERMNELKDISINKDSHTLDLEK